MKRLHIFLSCVASFVCAIEQAIAGTVVMDFEVLEQVDANLHDHGKFYSEDGFTIEAEHSKFGVEVFRSAGTLDTIFAGSTALFHANSEGEIILTKDDGTPFDLVSIDLAEVPPNRVHPDGPTDSGPFPLEFFGTKVGGGSVSQTLTIDSFLTLKTFTFSGFSNLVEVNWFQGPGGMIATGGGPTHQFDNIVLGDPIPEPSSIVLFALGAVGLVYMMRRP